MLDGPPHGVIDLPAGPVEYRELGSGRPVVFVHGALVNHLHWRKVAEELSQHYRCIFPTLPLGAHSRPMERKADLSLLGLSDLLDGFLEALGLEDVTLVGNDTGGGICQMMTAYHPDRVGSVVLLPADAFHNAPPPIFVYLHLGGFVPGFCYVLSQAARLKLVRNLPLAYGGLSKVVDHPVVDQYLAPMQTDRGVRRDLAKVLRGITPTALVTAARHFRAYERPVLLLWGLEKQLFPLSDAQQLADLYPKSQLETIEGARGFAAEDKPAEVSAAIRRFLG